MNQNFDSANMRFSEKLAKFISMAKSKLCLVFNIASKYREAIYKSIDKEWDCDWYFMKNTTDIKSMDLNSLAHVTEVGSWKIPRTPFYYQKGIPSLLWHKEYHMYFMLGELFSLSTWYFLLLRKVFFPKKKVYFWTHGWYGKETLIRKVLKKIFFKAVDGVFLYGNHAKQLMIKEGFDERKLFVIHNSLDYDRQLALRNSLNPSDIYQKHFGNNHHNLIFIGRLTTVKRIDLLLEALAMLKKLGKLYNLTLVGDGVERANLEEKVKKLGIDKLIWFYGACYDERINAELIYNADLCVSPGNVGLTAIHAMTFGCPVITHDNFPYQMPEFEAIKQGETGDFFQYDNVASIAECIGHWLEMASSHRESVRNHCYHEIDSYWTPRYQMQVIREHLL